MSQYFQIHAVSPQKRLIQQAAVIVQAGGVIVHPTDSTYALGCRIGDKAAMERVCAIRRLGSGHQFTLACRDLSEIATYAAVGNPEFRLMKAHTPGPYTFILPATREVPKRLLHPKRRTIGLRVPEHAIAQALLAAIGAPLLTTTLILPGDEDPLTDPEEIRARLEHQVDLVIDGGAGGSEPTTVVDLVGPEPVVVRAGKGDAAIFA
ncbi:MAG: threonylcarbamoyl-AMP synthase [Deltaproteobacteria bacterium]|nr:threonylcarbamoyl-AMP synthase [Deltaproteobacteria bacterium]